MIFFLLYFFHVYLHFVMILYNNQLIVNKDMLINKENLYIIMEYEIYTIFHLLYYFQENFKLIYD